MKNSLFLLAFGHAFASVPTAYFHGMHDDCQNNLHLTQVLSEDLGAPVECIEVGNGIETSMIMQFKKQAEIACQNLLNNPVFQVDEVNVIGFSQGGLIARYIAQDCPVKVRNLITVGTPNMGVTDTPLCSISDLSENLKALCSLVNFASKSLVYKDFLKDFSSTGYFRDSDNLSEYLAKSTFLSFLNNEVAHPKSVEYRDSITSLNSATFIMWDNDKILYPRETSHFDQLTSKRGKIQNIKFYLPSEQTANKIEPLIENQFTQELKRFEKRYETDPQAWGKRNLVKMVDTLWYQNDNLGLKTLNEANRVRFLHMPGGYDKFSVLEAQEMFIPALKL